MVDIHLEQAPYLATSPSLVVAASTDPDGNYAFNGIDGDQIHFNCAANSFSAPFEVEEIETGTFCKPSRTQQGTVTGSWTMTAYMSYGADGVWNNLAPLAGQTHEVAFLPKGATVKGVDNPEFLCTVTMPKLPPIGELAPGDKVEVELVLAWDSEPTSSTTGDNVARHFFQGVASPSNPV